MPVIKAGAFDLEYTDTGAGPAVVLVHSSASGHRQWRRLVETLQTRYRLIAVNLFGYGKTSSWPNARPLSAADQAELVAAASTLARESVALIGHSLGGAVALEAAAKLSDRIRVLVAFEPILFGHLKVHGPVSAYDEIARVASRHNALAQAGEWSAAGEWFVDYWAAPGTGRPCLTSASRARSRCCQQWSMNGTWQHSVFDRLKAGVLLLRPFT
jgi:pimeloyl-ACP methyl ester carboxylesterase